MADIRLSCDRTVCHLLQRALSPGEIYALQEHHIEACRTSASDLPAEATCPSIVHSHEGRDESAAKIRKE